MCSPHVVLRIQRSKSQIVVDRAKKKVGKNNTCYDSHKFESVTFVDVTPKDELAHNFERTVVKHKLRIKVGKRSGNTFKSFIGRT